MEGIVAALLGVVVGGLVTYLNGSFERRRNRLDERRGVARAIASDIRVTLRSGAFDRIAEQLRREADAMEKLAITGKPGVSPQDHFQLRVYDAFLPKLALLPSVTIGLLIEFYEGVVALEEAIAGLHENGAEELAERAGAGADLVSKARAESFRRVARQAAELPELGRRALDDVERRGLLKGDDSSE